MAHERRLEFAPFALDLVNECLWRGPRAIKLRPKAFAVLDHLVRRSGQLVTKDDLIAAVWPDTFVGDAVLKVTIRQLREALDDNPKAPRFIETSHRRGYRFIGVIDAPASAPPGGVVGRERALSRMHGWLEKSRRGERQIVFVTGEAGIGKTTLLDLFTRSLASGPAGRVCSGQCLEQYGMGEAYLPVLEAMRQLCRDDPRAVEPLMRTLRDDDARVRGRAAWALGELEDKRAVEGLMLALKDADIGIAMGTGADVAMEAAGLTIVQGDLRGVVRARRLSQDNVRIIRQNLFLAFVYNVVSVPVAAGVLYPFFGLLISPIWASLAMSLSSLSVVVNSLRLRR